MSYWFSDDTCLMMTENGYVDSKNMPLVFKHIDEYIRTVVRDMKHSLLILDGHCSRESIQWHRVCALVDFELVKWPAKTTNILQPCSNAVNKLF